MATIENIKEYNRIINELTIIATNPDTEQFEDPVLVVGQKYYNFITAFWPHDYSVEFKRPDNYFISGLEVILDESLSVGTVKVVERKHVKSFK